MFYVIFLGRLHHEAAEKHLHFGEERARARGGQQRHGLHRRLHRSRAAKSAHYTGEENHVNQ